MEIKRTVNVFAQKEPRAKGGEDQIRIRVKWDEGLITLNLGHNIAASKWDSKKCRVKNNRSNIRGISSVDINKAINKTVDAIQDCFKYFEVHESVPTKDELKARINEKLNRVPEKENNFVLTFNQYMEEAGRSWTDGTFAKFHTLKKHLTEYDKTLLKIDDDFISGFTDYLVNKGYQNTYIIKLIKLFHTFLRWSFKKGKLKEFMLELPTLKVEKGNSIIFLEWDEVMKIMNLTFPDDKNYLEHARNAFCFQCFTGLRYSDISALTWDNIDLEKGEINITAQKTAKKLSIPLSKYARTILEKYEGKDKPLHVATNQKMNLYIKEVAFLAEINQPIPLTTYKGRDRIDEVKPKYECIGTHTGKRTFVSNAIMLGVPPLVVMQITGNSDYKSLKPYIEIADNAKKEAMKMFDEK